jgi:hypothetical protein
MRTKLSRGETLYTSGKIHHAAKKHPIIRARVTQKAVLLRRGFFLFLLAKPLSLRQRELLVLLPEELPAQSSRNGLATYIEE